MTPFFRYIVVGVIANIVGLLAFQICILAGAAPEIATVIAFFPAFACAYLLNRLWSFSSIQTIPETIGRYCFATLSVILLQVVIVSTLVRGFQIVPALAQFIALLLATPVSYLLLSRWVFVPEPRMQHASEAHANRKK